MTGLDEKVRSVTCGFSDGTSEEFDLVIGCDGIASRTRELGQFDGDNEQTRQPQYSGIRITFGVCSEPKRNASSKQEAHQWFGDGAYVLNYTV